MHGKVPSPRLSCDRISSLTANDPTVRQSLLSVNILSLTAATGLQEKEPIPTPPMSVLLQQFRGAHIDCNGTQSQRKKNKHFPKATASVTELKVCQMSGDESCAVTVTKWGDCRPFITL